MPLEVKLHRGGIKTLYELKGINSQSFCGFGSNRHRFNLHFYTKSFSAGPTNKKAKPKTTKFWNHNTFICYFLCTGGWMGGY